MVSQPLHVSCSRTAPRPDLEASVWLFRFVSQCVFSDKLPDTVLDVFELGLMVVCPYVISTFLK